MNNINALITLALKEDRGSGDITTNALIPANHKSRAIIIAQEPGVICGLPLISAIYKKVNRNLRVTLKAKDGAKVRPGQVVATLKGPTRAILTGERTVLNFLQRLSGIATLTDQFVSQVKGTKVKILDTRKTVPGWRLLDKYAVKAGGGFNHRMGLYDAILIKNNHLKAMKSSLFGVIPAPAVGGGKLQQACPRESGGIQTVWGLLDSRLHGNDRKIKHLPLEIEVRNLNQFILALTLLSSASVSRSVIMLDNMTPLQIKEAVTIRNKTNNLPSQRPNRPTDKTDLTGLTDQTVLLEVSGGIHLGNIRQYAATGVDYISVGALTHSPRALDMALRIT